MNTPRSHPSNASSHDGQRGGQVTEQVIKNLAAGALARCMSASLMHPFDVVKTRLQFQIGSATPRHDAKHPYQIRSYANTLHAVKTIAKEEGFVALYKGLPVRLIYITPAAAVSFTVYEQFMRAVKHVSNGAPASSSANGEKPQTLTDIIQNWKYPILTLCAGATARVFGTACRTPFDIVKQRLQVEGQIVVNPASGSSKHLYKTMMAAHEALTPAASAAAANTADANAVAAETTKTADKSLRTRGIVGTFKQVLQIQGFKGLWSGYGVTLLRDAPFSAIYFTSYEAMKALQRKIIDNLTPLDHSRAKSVQHLIAGACAGAIATSCTIPIDVVKTRLQTQGKLGYIKYHGVMHAFKTIYKEEGIRAFKKGLGPRLTYLMPAAALTFTFYEHFKVLLGVNKQDDKGQNS